MKEIDTDVLIIGAGLVGLVAAHSLSSLNYNVTVIDKAFLTKNKKSFNDTRTVAVSEGSKQFLENLSLWSSLNKYAQPIKTININILGNLNIMNACHAHQVERFFYASNRGNPRSLYWDRFNDWVPWRNIC